jgi:hypothetical protein
LQKQAGFKGTDFLKDRNWQHQYLHGSAWAVDNGIIQSQEYGIDLHNLITVIYKK